MNLCRGRPTLDYDEIELAHRDEKTTGSYLEPKDQFFIHIQTKSYFRSDASTISSLTFQDTVRPSPSIPMSSWCCGGSFSRTKIVLPQPRSESKEEISRSKPNDNTNHWYACQSFRATTNYPNDNNNKKNKPKCKESKDGRKHSEGDNGDNNDDDTIPTRETASLFDNLSSDEEDNDEDDDVQRIRGSYSRRRKWRLLRKISIKKINRRRRERNLQTEIHF